MIGGVWMTRATPAPPARLEVLESGVILNIKCLCVTGMYV